MLGFLTCLRLEMELIAALRTTLIWDFESVLELGLQEVGIYVVLEVMPLFRGHGR